MLSTSGKLTWAELMGQSTGLVQPAQPALRASDAELQKLASQLPSFVAQSNVGSVAKLLGRLVAPVRSSTFLRAQCVSCVTDLCHTMVYFIDKSYLSYLSFILVSRMEAQICDRGEPHRLLSLML